MGYRFEKEEAVQKRNLDEHYYACSNDVEEDDNVENSNHIENHVSWTGQGSFFEASHGQIGRTVTLATVK